MTSKQTNLYVTREPGELLLPRASDAGNPVDPSRRKTLLQIAAMTGVAALPFQAQAAVDPPGIFLSNDGDTEYVTNEDIVDTVLIPFGDQVWNYIYDSAVLHGFAWFMVEKSDGKGGWEWDHGRIRDWFTRTLLLSGVVQLVKTYANQGQGQLGVKPVSAKLFTTSLIGVFGGYFTNVIEYWTWFMLHKRQNMSDQPARYLGFAVSAITTPTLMWTLYPLLVEALIGDRRLTKGTKETVKYAMDIVSWIWHSGPKRGKYDVKFHTVSRHDDDMLTHTALDHYVNMTSFTYDDVHRQALHFLRKTNYMMTGKVTRRDNPKIKDECIVLLNEVLICTQHLDYEATISIPCWTKLGRTP